MLLDRPGLAHDALASVLDDVDGVVRLRPGGDQDDTVPPDVIVVDDRLLQSGSALAVMTGARLIVVGVDDNPGFATRARRLRRRLGREGARRLAAARAAGRLRA